MRALRFAPLALVAACTTVQPPVPPPAPQTAYVRAPFDAVWSAATRYFADTRVPISTIDKASGIIVSNNFRLPIELFKRWGDCGTLSSGKRYVENASDVTTRAYADFNVFVQPAGDSTSVRVNAGVRADAMNPFAGNQFTPARCNGNGVFERELVEYIRKNAKP